MKNWISALLIFLMAFGLSACSTMYSNNSAPVPDASKEMIGLFSGAIIGGLVGSAVDEKGGGRVTAIGIGAIVGGAVGWFLGKYIDDRDQEKAMIAQGQKPYVRERQQYQARQSANWRQASNPVAPKQNVAAAAKRIERLFMTAANDKKIAPKTQLKSDGEKGDQLGLWRDVPSPQWFVNDTKKQENV